MIRKIFVFLIALCILVSNSAIAEEIDYSMLDPNPYNPETEPNIDMFISSWKEHLPRHIYGSLIERDIFTKNVCDPLNPHEKGAVLTCLNRFTHAVLQAHTSTTPAVLHKEQEIYYIASGKGTIQAGSNTAELYKGICVLMPPDIEFVMKNTGDDPLTMYIMAESVPEGFKPNKEMLVRDENVIPVTQSNAHWTHIYKLLFSSSDGLATLTGLGPCWYDPMTIGQPHSHPEGVEEIWFALEGDIHVLLGKHLRNLNIGSAYKIPPNGTVPHSNINAADDPMKLFWLMKNIPDYNPKQYGQLDMKPYDPETEPNIDMFMGSWKESMPRHTHGSLVERDILTRCIGDPMNPPVKGAVLKYVNRFTHAALFAHNSTTPTAPKGEQELFYVYSGQGTVTGGSKTYDLYPGITFLIPENLEFTINNTGDESLKMYLVVEPTPEGFRPNDYIVIHDEAEIPIATTTSHWVNIFKHLIKPEEGLAELQLVLTVWLAPGTFAQPHSHGEGVEEVWCTIEGDVKFLLGKQIRDLPPGTAYIIPPNDTTPHANFNITDDMLKIFYFARFKDHEPRK